MRTSRSGESGIALVIVMFMVMILSLLGSSLMFVSRTETLSSLNYQTVSQSRYAAESGVNAAANYLMFSYTAPTAASATDPLGSYTLTTSPVQYNGADVVLSSVAAQSNYPVSDVKTAFATNSAGSLAVGTAGTVSYSAKATLLSMRTITDAYSGSNITLQTWRIDGTGGKTGAGSASVEVSAVIEHGSKPAWQYAAFATNNGCDALKFGGGATTKSYDSSVANSYMTPSSSGANVGTNGNLDELGSTTTINGSLSTPRSGVGTCSANNVTALTQTNGATVTGGITQLSQSITYPTPSNPSPTPPTSSDGFSKGGGCPVDALSINYTVSCAASANGATIHPATASTVVTLGNVSLTGGAVLHLGAGTYDINSISMQGNSSIIIDSGPVVFKVMGTSQTTPIDLSGGSVSNSTYVSSNLQFVYGGTGDIKLTGGAASAATIYAPNAGLTFSGGGNFYGAVITGQVKDMGGASIMYDRHLTSTGVTDGNTVMDQFTWKNY